MEIPFLPLKTINQTYRNELETAFGEFLDSGYYILGKKVVEFEHDFAKYCDSKHCIGVANGLDALNLILESLEIEKGSEIIVPANTYFASILSILRSGFKPILIDPDPYDFLISKSCIEKAISSKTRAVMCVNLYGRMCNFEEISQLCKNYSLKLIVDAAQSHGAIFKGSTNCMGVDAAAYSFYPSKNLGAFADAGAIVTDKEYIKEKSSSLRNYGSSKKYNFEYLGVNSRLSELQAGLLSIKLKYLNEDLKIRRGLASNYLSNIKNPLLVLPPIDKIFEDSWHLFVIRTPKREELKKYLLEKKIGFDIHYPIAPHKQVALKEFSNLSLPITEEIHENVLSLPLNSTLSDLEIEYIITALNSFDGK